jgi:hypothetical protein
MVMERPIPMKNIMVTFRGRVYVRDKYYGHYEEQVITKRGFFHKYETDSLNGYYDAANRWVAMPGGYISVPPRWKEFNGTLLPDGWGGHRVKLEDVIKWEYCDDSNRIFREARS